MIVVHLTMHGDDAVALLEAYQGDDVSFKFEGKTGIKYKFAITGDVEAAMKKAKSLIKETQWGTNMYFSVQKG